VQRDTIGLLGVQYIKGDVALLVVTKRSQEKQSGGISMICDAFLEPNVLQHRSVKESGAGCLETTVYYHKKGKKGVKQPPPLIMPE
jgi:hypothetical protein